MKQRNTKILLGFTSIAVCLALVVSVYFVNNDRGSETALSLADGTYRTLYIRCEKTDEVETKSITMGSVTSTTQWFVFRCTARLPDEQVEYELDLPRHTGLEMHLNWSECNDAGLLLQADVVIDSIDFDRIVEESLDCVAADDVFKTIEPSID